MSSKVCNSCNEEKPTTEFWKNKRNKDGSGLCYRCIECSKKYNKEYYTKNRNKLIQQSTQYTKDNIESYREYKREWCANNKDKLHTYGRQYRQANKEKLAAKRAKERAIRDLRIPIWLTNDDYYEIEKFYTLSNCLELVTGVKYNVDHMIPLNGDLVSGLHVPDNLQVITASENYSKRNSYEITV